MTLELTDLDGALRVRLTEPQWRAISATAGELPDWAAPIEHSEPDAASDDATTDETGADVGDAEDAPDVAGPALAAALGLRAAATLHVDVAVADGARGLLATLWTDGRTGAVVVRGLDLRREGRATATRRRAGVEVSAFPAGNLTAEVLRLVPPMPNRVDAVEAVVPEELTIGLAAALRTGDTATTEAVCAELGLESPPAVVAAAVGSLRGDLGITVRGGRGPVTTGHWLACDAGWVELGRTPDGMIRHTPRTAADLAATLRFDLAGRLADGGAA